MISLPFTITALILTIACSISKIQYSSTYLAIAIHAFLGPLQTASLIVTFVQYSLYDWSKMTIRILLIASFVFIGVFNFIAFAIQTPFIAEDRKFLKWLKQRDFQKSTKFNLYWFYFLSIFTLFTNYKLKMILFSRLFSFECLKCQLQNLEKFKLFNIFVFLGLIPEIIILYCACVEIFSIDSSFKVFSMLIDIIIVVTLNVIFSILSVIKQQDFFKQEIEGLSINKVVNLAQQSFQTAVKIGREGNHGYALDDIIQVNEAAFETTKRDVVNIQPYNRRSKVDEEKLQGQNYSEEKTVTDRQSESKNEESEFFRQRQLKKVSSNLPNNEHSSHNILMVDEYFSFGSQNCENVNQRGAQYSEDLEMNVKCPNVQIKRNQEVLEQLQNLSDKDNVNAHEQQEKSGKKVNLAQYLIDADKRLEVSRKKKQVVQKYDKLDLTQQAEKMGQFQQRKIDAFAKETQFVQFEGQMQFEAIDNQSSINFKSQPTGFKPKKIPTLTNRLQPSSYQIAIQKIRQSHNSPKKDISEDRIQMRSKRIKENKTSFKLNEDHEQRVVSNRSKEKIKSIHNHPINSPENKKSQRSANKSLTQQSEFFQQKSNAAKRQHLKVKKLNDQNIRNKVEKMQDSENVKTVNTMKQDSFFNEFLKYQDEVEKKQEIVKEFKRSIPQSLTFFPHKKTKEVELRQNNQSNHPPRKPTSSIIQRLKQRFSAKSRQKSERHIEHGIFYRSSKNVKRNKSSESKRNNFDQPRRKQSEEHYRAQSYFSEDKQKKYSMQKIYLEKLTR